MITRLNLWKDGEWIDVKDRQTVEDEENVHEYSNDGLSADGKETKYNIVKHRAATAAVRIKAWSVTNVDGKVIHWPASGSSFKERVAVVRRLDEEQLDSISEVLPPHLNALKEARDQEKKEIQAGKTDSAASSPSVN